MGESDFRPAIRDAAWLATEAVQLPESSSVNPSPSALPESLSGLIERVTFFNEENGFGVLKVKAKGHRDLVTVVGSLPSVSPGEWLTAQGRWVQEKGVPDGAGDAPARRAWTVIAALVGLFAAAKLPF